MKFMSTRWTNLLLATYLVPEELLLPHLPPGLELDRREGRCFVSLVALDFSHTKVLGIPWPGFRNFPEINLRFYVRQGERRGVVFIRELVPQRLVAWLARVLYNEPYRATTMTSAVQDEASQITVVHRLDWGGQMNLIRATGSKPAVTPPPDSVEHYFKEHEWGFGMTRRKRTLEYRVVHPVWEIYPVIDWQVDWDFGGIYGPEWKFLEGAKPISTVLAAGSAVSIYWGQKL
jgi:uncharacterized protein YqjF (DUF2071 family)